MTVMVGLDLQTAHSSLSSDHLVYWLDVLLELKRKGVAACDGGGVRWSEVILHFNVHVIGCCSEGAHVILLGFVFFSPSYLSKIWAYDSFW